MNSILRWLLTSCYSLHCSTLFPMASTLYGSFHGTFITANYRKLTEVLQPSATVFESMVKRKILPQEKVNKMRLQTRATKVMALLDYMTDQAQYVWEEFMDLYRTTKGPGYKEVVTLYQDYVNNWDQCAHGQIFAEKFHSNQVRQDMMISKARRDADLYPPLPKIPRVFRFDPDEVAATKDTKTESGALNTTDAPDA